ncbi:hypothetical protein Tco_1447609 [Tanacetum coccineum]
MVSSRLSSREFSSTESSRIESISLIGSWLSKYSNTEDRIRHEREDHHIPGWKCDMDASSSELLKEYMVKEEETWSQVPNRSGMPLDDIMKRRESLVLSRFTSSVDWILDEVSIKSLEVSFLFSCSEISLSIPSHRESFLLYERQTEHERPREVNFPTGTKTPCNSFSGVQIFTVSKFKSHFGWE